MDATPARRPRPAQAASYLLRVVLESISPAIWREIEVDSTLTLDRLHPYLQLAMGWSDQHLHEFAVGEGMSGGQGLVRFIMDLPPGYDQEPADRETEVHLDELLQQPGDQLWYLYDFGDQWFHCITLMGIRSGPPPVPTLVAAQNACPPENIGGRAQYQELLDYAANPKNPTDPHTRDLFDYTWPSGVIKQEVDLAAINATLAMKPASVAEAMHPWQRDARPDLIAFMRRIPFAPDIVAATQSVEYALGHARPADPLVAAPATENLRWLLEYVGDGLPLTAAGYLKPAHVAVIADKLEVFGYYRTETDHESDVFPVFIARRQLQRLGLLRATRGTLVRTKAGQRLTTQPEQLWLHLAARVPGRCSDHERDATFAYLLAVSDAGPGHQVWERAASLMAAIGWQSHGEYTINNLLRGTIGIRSLMEMLHGVERALGDEGRTTEIGVEFARAVLAAAPRTR